MRQSPGPVVRLAGARLRAHPGRWLPAAGAVAALIALLGVLSGYATLTADRAASGVLHGVPAVQRTVTVSASGGVTPAVARSARRALAGITPAAQTRSLLLLPARFGRDTVRLAAIAPLGRWVRITAGRAPRPCRPARCEVLQAGGLPLGHEVRDRGTRLVVVGRARVVAPIPLGFVPRPAQPGEPDPQLRTPVLLAASPAEVDGLAGLDGISRVQSWTAGLDLAALRSWDVSGARDRLIRAQRATARTDGGLTVSGPLVALDAARARAKPVPSRVLALGAGAGGALVAFLLLVAGAMRASIVAELARLERSGATVGQRATLVLTECGGPVVAGGVAGVAITVAVIMGLGSSAAVSASVLLRHGVSTERVVLEGVGAAAAAWALLILVASASRRWGQRLAELALVAAAAALVASLVDDGTRTGASDATLRLPLLVFAVGGLLLARALPRALRAAGRLAPRRGLGRLALLDVGRRPAPFVLTAVALALAVALATFAVTYQDTLRTGQRDQARFRVPLQAAVTRTRALERPLQGVPLSRYAAVPGVRRVDPVLRRDAEVVLGPSRQPVSLLAVPARTLAAIGMPRAGALATREPGIAGATVAGGSNLRLRARAAGDDADVGVLLLRDDGTTQVVQLAADPRAPTIRSARIPPAPSPLRVAGLTLAEAQASVATGGHQAANDTEGALTSAGRLTLGPLRDGTGRVVASSSSWTPHGAARSWNGSVVAYDFGEVGDALLRPTARIDRRPLPVLTDAATARDAGPARRLELATAGATLPAVVVGVVPRAATVGEDAFVVADSTAVRAALDAVRPGAGAVDELWVQAPSEAARTLAGNLGRVGGARVVTRARVLDGLTRDPLSRGLLRVLSAGALLALALALLAVGVAVRAIRRDGAAAHADLEADGLPPGALRRIVAIQAAVAGVAGVAAGTALGLSVSTLGAAAVRAGSSPARPPLHTVAPIGPIVVGAGVGTAALVLVVALLARAAFREAWPVRTLSTEPA